MRIGSLCSGYGGLEMAVQAVFGGEVAWHCENDKDAAKILAHHYPEVPNYGDLTDLTWAQDPVDVLAAGFPCQPVSHAGNRHGVNDERWLFDDIVTGISRMDPRPRLLVFENVTGLLTANGGDAMARVVQGLAQVGYVGRYRVVRAADAGAPHGRARVFIVAHPDDPGRPQPGWPVAARAELSSAERGRRAAADTCGGPFAGAAATRDGLPVAAERGPVAAADPGGERYGCGEDGRGLGRVDLGDAGEARQRERAREVAGDRSATLVADPDGGGCEGGWQPEPRGVSGAPGCEPDGPAVAWGQYAPAIRRWERVLGRVAPPPTEVPEAWLRDRAALWETRRNHPMPVGRRGSLQRFVKAPQRLSPRFVEWMMGLPDGHVTQVPISRPAKLKALGNGVVPQQAELALRLLAPEERPDLHGVPTAAPTELPAPLR